jgi:prolipoprotein diacylglyceryltransferase
MEFYILFLLLALVVFTYTLYLLGREDVIFIRKNVTLEQLFNIFFLTLFVSLFLSRLVYVLIHPSWQFLNPLNFFSLISKPGLSVIGGVIGAGLYLVYYARLRRLPLGRIFDFFALSFFSALPVGVFGAFFLSDSLRFTESIFLPILYLILFIFLVRVVFPKLLQGSLKNGSIGLIVLILFSLIWVLTSMVRDRPGIFGFVTIEDVLAGITFLVSAFVLIRQEGKNR